MSPGDSRLLSAEELRQVFDHRFAVAAHDERAETEEFLGIRVHSKPYAIPIMHLVRIETVRKVVPLPGFSPDHVGVAGIQGRLVAVFRLSHLLNLNPGLEQDHWIAVCNREHPIGLSFHAVDGLLQFPTSDIVDHGGSGATPLLKKTIAERQGYRPVVDVVEIARTVLQTPS